VTSSRTPATMACDCSAKRCDGVRPQRRTRYIEVGRPDDVGGRPACGRVSVHVRLLWTTLSVMVTIGCTYSFIQPAWYVHSITRDRLGLFNYCVRDPRMSTSVSGPPKTLWPARYSTSNMYLAEHHAVTIFTTYFSNWREVTVPNRISSVLFEISGKFSTDKIGFLRRPLDIIV